MRGVPLLLACALLALPLRSRAAETPPIDLTWSAPPECATKEDVLKELARVARVRPGRAVAPVSARGRIERSAGAYRLTLSTEQNGVSGERSLVAEECRSLEREVTLVLALAFGEGVELVNTDAASPADAPPTAPQRPDAASPADVPPTAPRRPDVAPNAASREAAARRTTAPLPNKEKSWRGAALLGGGVLFGALPSPAAYVTAGAELGVRRLWLEPRLEWLPRVDESLARGVRARYDGFGGALAGCALPLEAVALSACVAGEATAIRARSWGASEGGEAVAPLFGGALSLGFRWPSRSLVSLRLEAALHVAFNEPHFVVEGLGEAHHVPRFAPSLGAIVLFSPAR